MPSRTSIYYTLGFHGWIHMCDLLFTLSQCAVLGMWYLFFWVWYIHLSKVLLVFQVVVVSSFVWCWKVCCIVHANMVVGLGWFHFNITTVIYFKGGGPHSLCNWALSTLPSVLVYIMPCVTPIMMYYTTFAKHTIALGIKVVGSHTWRDVWYFT